MKLELIQPYVQAAREVIAEELGGAVTPGKVALRRPPATAEDVAVLIGVTGNIEGVVLLMMTRPTALNIVTRMMGEPYAELDDMAQSAIAEIANVISGRASTDLATTGCATNINPPTILLGGAHSEISTLAIPLFDVPLETDCGTVDLQVALKPAA